MPTDQDIFEVVVPHEAGHIVVAHSFHIAVQHIGFRLRDGCGTPFASVWQPDDHELRDLADERRIAYCNALAGGIAGELFSRGCSDPSNDDPATFDRVLLARLTPDDIMDFVPTAEKIIYENRRVFRQLCSRMKMRYPEVRRKIEASTGDGVHVLITQQELTEILR